MITKNNELVFKNIDHENYRTYVFSDITIRIDNPIQLNVSASGGHRLLDAGGVSHYIPCGWKHLYWEVSDDVNFRF